MSQQLDADSSDRAAETHDAAPAAHSDAGSEFSEERDSGKRPLPRWMLISGAGSIGRSGACAERRRQERYSRRRDLDRCVHQPGQLRRRACRLSRKARRSEHRHFVRPGIWRPEQHRQCWRRIRDPAGSRYPSCPPTHRARKGHLSEHRCRPHPHPHAAAAHFGVDKGLFVQSTTIGGPAEAAGIRPGDFIKRINGRETATLDVLTPMRLTSKAGDVITIDYSRNGRDHTAEVTLVD
ncbi:PDZ domain-containing protein [Microbacterium sp. NPDC055665]